MKILFHGKTIVDIYYLNRCLYIRKDGLDTSLNEISIKSIEIKKVRSILYSYEIRIMLNEISESVLFCFDFPDLLIRNSEPLVKELEKIKYSLEHA